MLADIEPAGTQIPEKTLRIAYPGDGVHTRSSQVLQRLRTRKTVHPMCLSAEEAHPQGTSAKRGGAALGKTIDDHDIGSSHARRRLA